jgi:hypothetical protein
MLDRQVRTRPRAPVSRAALAFHDCILHEYLAVFHGRASASIPVRRPPFSPPSSGRAARARGV